MENIIYKLYKCKKAKWNAIKIEFSRNRNANKSILFKGNQLYAKVPMWGVDDDDPGTSTRRWYAGAANLDRWNASLNRQSSMWPEKLKVLGVEIVDNESSAFIYQKSCKWGHETFFCQFPWTAILFLVNFLKYGEVDVNKACIYCTKSVNKMIVVNVSLVDVDWLCNDLQSKAYNPSQRDDSPNKSN